MGLVTDLDLAGLTEGTVDGNGVFDVLMKATKAHLKEEFEKGRIKGSDYANVYAGSIVAVMAQSVQFYTQSELGKKQIEKTEAEISLIGKQEDKIDSDILLAGEQILLAKEEVLLKKKDQDLRQAEISIAEAQLVNIPKQGNLLDSQVIRIDSEVDLLGQKLQTEKAQTEGSLTKTGNVWDLLPEADSGYVGGTLGRQMILHATQADGFLRDAEQKAANKLIDTWNIRRSTDTGTIPSTEAHLTDNDIGKFIEKMASGINMSL